MTAGIETLEILRTKKIYQDPEKKTSYLTAKTSDTKRFAQFFIEMMNQGIYLPPSQVEAWFLSIAHTQKDLDRTIEACDMSFKKM